MGKRSRRARRKRGPAAGGQGQVTELSSPSQAEGPSSAEVPLRTNNRLEAEQSDPFETPSPSNKNSDTPSSRRDSTDEATVPLSTRERGHEHHAKPRQARPLPPQSSIPRPVQDSAASPRCARPILCTTSRRLHEKTPRNVASSSSTPYRSLSIYDGSVTGSTSKDTSPLHEMFGPGSRLRQELSERDIPKSISDGPFRWNKGPNIFADGVDNLNSNRFRPSASERDGTTTFSDGTLRSNETTGMADDFAVGMAVFNTNQAPPEPSQQSISQGISDEPSLGNENVRMEMDIADLDSSLSQQDLIRSSQQSEYPINSGEPSSTNEKARMEVDIGDGDSNLSQHDLIRPNFGDPNIDRPFLGSEKVNMSRGARSLLSSRHSASSAIDILGRRGNGVVKARYFKSRRVQQQDIQRPWLDRKDSREKWLWIFPCFGILAGLCLSALLVWDGLRNVINHSYCQILDEDFSYGLDPSIWTKEAEVGGFGNGQFEMTTVTDENVFIDDDGQLTIRPTLQDPTLIYHNTIVNLTKMGICSSSIWSDCVAVTNVTNGTIVNPVRSGRISTRRGPSIKYGRVEVTATLPAGDWLWPAIWMLPVNASYGPWPESGEIDIMESRGNNYTYPQGGDNIMSSTLHWGPSPTTDAWWRTNSKRTAIHSTFADGPHIFGMEWSESYIFTYVDNRLLQVLYFDFSGDLWQRGAFPLADANGTRFVDPWSQTGKPSTPFDQDFYLILDLAVGATNGWFQDGVAGKPWVDGSKTAKLDFWNAQDAWYPTWINNGDFKVSRVRMWQQEGYNGCLESDTNRKKQRRGLGKRRGLSFFSW